MTGGAAFTVLAGKLGPVHVQRTLVQPLAGSSSQVPPFMHASLLQLVSWQVLHAGAVVPLGKTLVVSCQGTAHRLQSGPLQPSWHTQDPASPGRQLPAGVTQVPWPLQVFPAHKSQPTQSPPSTKAGATQDSHPKPDQ